MQSFSRVVAFAVRRSILAAAQHAAPSLPSRPFPALSCPPLLPFAFFLAVTGNLRSQLSFGTLSQIIHWPFFRLPDFCVMLSNPVTGSA
jgi:hypothetical protein